MGTQFNARVASLVRAFPAILFGVSLMCLSVAVVSAITWKDSQGQVVALSSLPCIEHSKSLYVWRDYTGDMDHRVESQAPFDRTSMRATARRTPSNPTGGRWGGQPVVTTVASLGEAQGINNTSYGYVWHSDIEVNALWDFKVRTFADTGAPQRWGYFDQACPRAEVSDFFGPMPDWAVEMSLPNGIVLSASGLVEGNGSGARQQENYQEVKLTAMDIKGHSHVMDVRAEATAIQNKTETSGEQTERHWQVTNTVSGSLGGRGIAEVGASSTTTVSETTMFTTSTTTSIPVVTDKIISDSHEATVSLNLSWDCDDPPAEVVRAAMVGFLARSLVVNSTTFGARNKGTYGVSNTLIITVTCRPCPAATVPPEVPPADAAGYEREDGAEDWYIERDGVLFALIPSSGSNPVVPPMGDFALRGGRILLSPDAIPSYVELIDDSVDAGPDLLAAAANSRAQGRVPVAKPGSSVEWDYIAVGSVELDFTISPDEGTTVVFDPFQRVLRIEGGFAITGSISEETLEIGGGKTIIRLVPAASAFIEGGFDMEPMEGQELVDVDVGGGWFLSSVVIEEESELYYTGASFLYKPTDSGYLRIPGIDPTSSPEEEEEEEE